MLVGILLAALAFTGIATATPAPQAPTPSGVEAIPRGDVVAGESRTRLASELARIRVRPRADVLREIRIRIEDVTVPPREQIERAREITREALAEARVVLEIERGEIERLRHPWLDCREAEHASGLAGGIVEWTPKLGVLLGVVVEVGARLLLTGMELAGLA